MAKIYKMCNVYEAYNSDNELIARGFSDDVSQVIGCCPQSLSSIHGEKIVNKFRVVYLGKKKKTIENNVDYSYRSAPKETFVERYRDLEYYGNTIMDRHEYARHKELIEDKGYHVKYTKKRDKRKVYYLLEVI